MEGVVMNLEGKVTEECIEYVKHLTESEKQELNEILLRISKGEALSLEETLAAIAYNETSKEIKRRNRFLYKLKSKLKSWL